MKKTALLLSLILSACATDHQFTPAPQSYRPQNSDKTIQITAKINQKLTIGLVKKLTSHLIVYFDGQIQIEGDLDNQVNGDIQGNPFNGKPTSASCSTKTIAQNTGETRCQIFIENERITTLTM